MRDQFVIIFSYLHGIWQYRWSALIIAWVVAISGWVTTSTLPDQYTSSAVVHVNTESLITPLLKDLAIRTSIDDGVTMMTRVLLTRENLEEVVRQTDMNLKARTADEMDDLVEQLASSIVLTEPEEKVRKDETVYILSYEGESPELVFQVVTKLLDIIIETTKTSAQTDTTAAESFLDQQIKVYAKRLSVAEKKLADFKRTNVGYMPDDKAGGYYSKLQEAQSEADDIRTEIRVAKNKLIEIKKQLSGQKPIARNSGPQAEQLREYRAQLAELRTQFTEQHPDIQSLKLIISELLATEDSTGSDSSVPLKYTAAYQDLKVESHQITAELADLKAALAEKQSQIKTLRKSADVIPEVEAKLAMLNRDYDITHKRYLAMVERKESARLAHEVGLSGSNINFKVVAEPKVAESPSGPPRIIFNSIIFLVAIIAGLGWGYFRYLMHPTYIDTSQIKDNIDIPVLGSIGLYMTTEHKKRRRLQLTSFLSIFSFLVLVYVLVIMPDAKDSEEESLTEVVSVFTLFNETVL